MGLLTLPATGAIREFGFPIFILLVLFALVWKAGPALMEHLKTERAFLEKQVTESRGQQERLTESFGRNLALVVDRHEKDTDRIVAALADIDRRRS